MVSLGQILSRAQWNQVTQHLERDTGSWSWVCAPGSCSGFSQRICHKLLLSVRWKTEGKICTIKLSPALLYVWGFILFAGTAAVWLSGLSLWVWYKRWGATSCAPSEKRHAFFWVSSKTKNKKSLNYLDFLCLNIYICIKVDANFPSQWVCASCAQLL